MPRVYKRLAGERGRMGAGMTRHGRRFGELLAEHRDELRPPTRGASCRGCHAYGVALSDGKCRICASLPEPDRSNRR